MFTSRKLGDGRRIEDGLVQQSNAASNGNIAGSSRQLLDRQAALDYRMALAPRAPRALLEMVLGGQRRAFGCLWALEVLVHRNGVAGRAWKLVELDAHDLRNGQAEVNLVLRSDVLAKRQDQSQAY